MKHAQIVVLLLAVTCVFVGGAIGCDSAPEPALDESEVRAYADPATETLLQGLSEGDRDKYIEYGNQEFKAAVTEELFDQVVDQIEAQFGTYVSKEYLSAEVDQGYVIVHYRATYTEGDIGVRMVFDDEQKVAGQFFE